MPNNVLGVSMIGTPPNVQLNWTAYSSLRLQLVRLRSPQTRAELNGSQLT